MNTERGEKRNNNKKKKTCPSGWIVDFRFGFMLMINYLFIKGLVCIIWLDS